MNKLAGRRWLTATGEVWVRGGSWVMEFRAAGGSWIEELAAEEPTADESWVRELGASVVWMDIYT